MATTDGAALLGPRRLRVSVDALNLRREQSGLRTYTLGLLRALGTLEDHDFHVITTAPEILDGTGRVSVHHVNARLDGVVRRAVWRERNLSALVKDIASDVHLVLVPELPMRRLGRPCVVVVHDLGPIVSPLLYGARRAARQAIAFRHVARRADRFVCVSCATRDALVELLDVDPTACRVIPEGPQVVADRRHPDGFALYVGSLHRHKNVDTLVRAFADNRIPEGLRLFIAGPSAPEERERIAQLAESLGISARVHHWGFVDPRRLAELYGSATLVALPSLHEGFGLTVLEAMCSRVPVVSSELSSVREIAGNAALYVSEPRCPAMWADAISRVATDPASMERSSRDAEIARAKFSWESAAIALVDVLRDAAP